MTSEVWASDAWRADARTWLDAQLTALGRVRTGPLEQPRVRPWGTVLHAPTDAGRVWLKAPAPSMRFELALLRALAGLGLPGVPGVLGVDEARGLLLLADAGTSFRQRWADDAENARQFAACWPLVARLQRATAPLVPDLLAAGVADLRPDALPARFDEALARARADHGDDPADAAVLDRLEAARPAFVAACERLARSAVPVTVDHNDLHHGNLMVATDGTVTVVDWGDAVIAHPFSTLLVAERVLASLLGDVGTGHPAVRAARAAYLAEFAGDAPGEDLDTTARLATAVSQVARAWVWQRALDTFTDADRSAPPVHWPADFHRGALRHLGLATTALAAID